MQRLAVPLGLLLVLALAGCDEQRPPSPAAAAAAASAARREAERKEMLPVLVEALPEQLAEFRATGPAKGEPSGSGPLDFATAERSYENADRKLTVTINDWAKIGLIEPWLTLQRRLTEDPQAADKLAVPQRARALRIGGRLAVARHFAVKQTNEIEILVAQRFLVTLQLTPARGPDDALPAARALVLDGLLAL